MNNPHTCTKQYYVIRYKSGENPHWYDDQGELWSVDNAKKKRLAVIEKLSDRKNVEAKIVVRTEITNTLDVDLVLI